MIVNPACYEQLCNDYKLECQKNKTKRISLAQISLNYDGSFNVPQGIKATTTSNEFEHRNAFVGKIVFYKDYDTVSHPVEKMMG